MLIIVKDGVAMLVTHWFPNQDFEHSSSAPFVAIFAAASSSAERRRCSRSSVTAIRKMAMELSLPLLPALIMHPASSPAVNCLRFEPSASTRLLKWPQRSEAYSPSDHVGRS